MALKYNYYNISSINMHGIYNSYIIKQDKHVYIYMVSK